MKIFILSVILQNDNNVLTEIAKNIPSIITGLTAVLTAFFAGLFTWLISKNQIKIKIKELDINNEFKARKLIYKEYEKGLDKHLESVEKSNKSLSELYALFVIEGFDKIEREVKIFCDSYKNIILNSDNPYPELKFEIQKENIPDTFLNFKLDEVNKLFNEFSNKENIIEDYQEEFFKIKRFLDLINDIENEILKHKREKLFNKYTQ